MVVDLFFGVEGVMFEVMSEGGSVCKDVDVGGG